MSSSQGMRKKDEITSIINSILDQAARTRGGFTPEVVRGFEVEGRRAADQRREERQQAPPREQAPARGREERMREVTPSRQLNIVVRRAEEVEQQRESISPLMTQTAIQRAVGLGEILELAAQGRKLNLRNWVLG